MEEFIKFMKKLLPEKLQTISSKYIEIFAPKLAANLGHTKARSELLNKPTRTKY